MVIGLNGYIWLSDHVPDEEDREREAQEEQVTRVIEVSDTLTLQSVLLTPSFLISLYPRNCARS